jgi:hypothetical protein
LSGAGGNTDALVAAGRPLAAAALFVDPGFIP